MEPVQSAKTLIMAWPPSRNEDQLARRLPRLEIAVGVGRLGERERLADVQPQPALAHESEAALGAFECLVGKVPRHRRQPEAADLMRLRRQRGVDERRRWS